MVAPSLLKAHIDKHRQFVLTGEKHMFDRRVVLKAMCSDGSEFPVELTLTSLKAEGVNLLTGFLRDISQQQKAQREIENFAYYDVLTGFSNHRLLIDRFQQAVLTSDRTQTYFALIFVDLDHFKALNDIKGHDIGDQLLVKVANRIKNTILAGDTVARLSGDEFIVMIENFDIKQNTAYGQASEVAQKILLELNKSYFFDMFVFNTTASLGVTLFNDAQFSFEDHLRHADNAMYQSKAAGRNTYRFYDKVTQAELEKIVLESTLNLRLKTKSSILTFKVLSMRIKSL